MSDLIERDEVIKTICECECYSGDNPCKEGKSCYAVRMIRAIPSADAVSLEEFEQMRFLADKSMEMVGEERPKGEWISCGERLPEDIRPVLITWKNTDPASYYQYIVGKHYIGTAHYHRGKWYWYSSVTEDLLAEYGKCDSEEFDEAIEAVAWMPLPKPYEETDHE